MKTRSSSPNLIWTLTDLLCFNPVGDHREESDCQQTQGGLDTSWLWGWTQRPPYWALAQTQSEGERRLNGETLSKSFSALQIKRNGHFLNGVRLRQIGTSEGRRPETHNDAEKAGSTRVQRLWEWDSELEYTSREATLQGGAAWHDICKQTTLPNHKSNDICRAITEKTN